MRLSIDAKTQADVGPEQKHDHWGPANSYAGRNVARLLFCDSPSLPSADRSRPQRSGEPRGDHVADLHPRRFPA
jgi:hypothetical protein